MFRIIDFVTRMVTVPIIMFLCNTALHRRISLKKFIAISLVSSIVIASFEHILHEGFLVALTFFSLSFVLVCLMFSDSISKKIIVFSSIVLVFFIGEFLSFLIFNRRVSPDSLHNLSVLNAVIYTSSAIMLSFGLGFFVIKVQSLYFNGKNRRYNVLLTAYILMQILNLFLYSYFWWENGVQSIASIIYTALPILWLAFTLYLINSIKKFERKDLEAEFIKEQLDMQKSYFSHFKTQYEQMRRLRHDFANFKDTISTMFNSGQIAKGNELLESLSSFVEDYTKTITSGNEAIDALVFYKLQTASEKGIKCNIQIKIPQNIYADMDLCSLISNLLDNAIEANENVSESKHIALISMEKLGYLAFVLRNSFNNGTLNELKTTKHDKENHGIGFRIIESIIKKYDGYSMISTEANDFCHVVYLKLPQNNH